MSTPAQLPADFFNSQQGDAPAQLPADHDFGNVPHLVPSHQAPIDNEKLAHSLVTSHVLNIPTATAYQNSDLVQKQLTDRGIEAPSTMSAIANDIKIGAEESIFGLAYRHRMPDTLQHPGVMDKFITGISQMVADLPFYLGGYAVGGVVGGAAGSAVPVIGNVAGAVGGSAMGTFAIPAAIRESLVLGIQKGDIKSFGDLVSRTLSAMYSGEKGALTGLATEASGGATLVLGKALGPAAQLAEVSLRKLQQAAALTIVPKVLEGQMPDANDFAVNVALMAAMHFGVAGLEQAGAVVPKLQAKVQDVYVEQGAHPGAVAAEALRQAQADPTEDVVGRINQITRTAPVEASAESAQPEVVKGETVAPSEPPASLQPATRDESGTVTVAKEGDTAVATMPQTEQGFVDREGAFLTGDEAKAKLRETEPEVYRNWELVSGGPDEPLTPTNYNEAVMRSTGVKNAMVDTQRQQMGLPPIESPTRSLDPNSWEQTKADVDSGKIDPLAIANSINDSPRGLSPEETNALNYYRARLSNEHKTTMDAIEKARVDGDTAAEQRNMEQLHGIEDRINTVDGATKKAGTEWGLTGVMRQQTVAQDYSLDRLLQRARVASPDGVVSPDVRNNLEALTRQLDVANKRLDEYQNEAAQREAQRATERIKADVERGQRKANRQRERVQLSDEFDGLVKEFDSLIMGRMSANPFFDPEVIGLVGKMARNRIESGITHIEDIVDSIHAKLTDLGHDVEKRDIRDAISGYGKTIEMSKDAINVALREAKQQGRLLSALEDAQAKLEPLKSGLQRDKASERVKELQQQVKQAMRDAGMSTTTKLSDEARLERYKKTINTRIADMENRLNTGNFNKEPQQKTVLDAEAATLKLKAEKLRNQMDNEIAKQELVNRTPTEKALGYLNKWRRATLLTSWHTLGKLQSAAMLRMGVTPIEELIGGVLSHVPGISEISQRAPFEGGGFNVGAEAKALSQFWQKATADDTWESIKSGKTSLDILYGDKRSLPPEALDFIGHLHGALKVIPKRAEFFRRVEKGTQWAIDNNLDTSDPRVQTAIMGQAYEHSLRSILMQKNAVTGAYQAFLSYLHNQGAGGKTIEATARFLLPIVHVPTNFVAESLAYTPGSPVWQTMQVFRVLTDKDKMGRSAMDNLTMHDMDNIMRGLKKGSLGLALMAAGYALRRSVTGYYRENKKRIGDPSLGSIKVGNAEIPVWLAESPALQALQLGATIGKVWDHYGSKGMSGGLIAGTGYGIAGMVKQTPFMEEPARLAEGLRTPESASVMVGELTGSLMIPLLAGQIARERDPLADQRKAHTFTDAIKLQIPGLRETVPVGGRRHTTHKGY